MLTKHVFFERALPGDYVSSHGVNLYVPLDLATDWTLELASKSDIEVGM